MSDTQLDQVTAAIDVLLSECDPRTMDDREFRGHRYDAGLAWVHCFEGYTALGIRPDGTIVTL